MFTCFSFPNAPFVLALGLLRFCVAKEFSIIIFPPQKQEWIHKDFYISVHDIPGSDSPLRHHASCRIKHIAHRLQDHPHRAAVSSLRVHKDLTNNFKGTKCAGYYSLSPHQVQHQATPQQQLQDQPHNSNSSTAHQLRITALHQLQLHLHRTPISASRLTHPEKDALELSVPE